MTWFIEQWEWVCVITVVIIILMGLALFIGGGDDY